jgi:hypothetical protein
MRGYFDASDLSDHVMQSPLKHTKRRRAICCVGRFWHWSLLVVLPAPLAVRTLTIDHSFIIDVEHNRRGKNVVAIVTMAHAFCACESSLSGLKRGTSFIKAGKYSKVDVLWISTREKVD